MHTALITYFEHIQPLDNTEKKLISSFFEEKILKKGEFLLKEGEVCTHFYFVEAGCLRMYKTDEKGNVHILSFATENWLVTDILSFRNEKSAQMNIDALEKTQVLQILHQNLQELYRKIPKLNFIIRELLEKHTAFLQQRLLQNMYASAQDRYQTFLAMYPKLPQRISHTQIAYYLGITPEFLSKIRKNLL